MEVVMAKSGNGSSQGNGKKPTSTNIINGGDGDDILFGTVGADTINAGKGDDIIYADAGSDTVMAGAGNDVIIHSINDNLGSKDYYDGGSGKDTLQLIVTQEQYDIIQKALSDFSAWDKTQVFDFSKYSKDIDLKIVNIEHITFEILEPTIQFQNSQSTTSDKDDTLIGTDFNDMLVGGPGNDHLFGNDGDDRLVGGDGNDHLIGGNGNDVIIGGAGDDCINAGAGNDVVNGGAGADTVIHFVDENQGFHDYYQDSGTSVQNDGQDKLILVFNDSDYEKIATLIYTMETDFAAAKKNGVVFDFNQYNSELSALLGYPKALNIGTKGFELLEVINATEAQNRADQGEECYGTPHQNHAPVAVPDNFVISEDDAFGQTIVLGNKLANDTDADGDSLTVVSVQNVSLDTSGAGSEFAGMTATLTHGDFVGGNPTITLEMDGKTAVITVAADGTETLSDPDHLFDALNSGESLVINASYTNSDGSLTSSALQSITINGVNETLIATPDNDILVMESALDLFKDGADLAPGTRTGTNPSSTGETDSTDNSLVSSISGGSGVNTFTLVGGVEGLGFTTMVGTYGTIKLFADGIYVYTLTSPVTGAQADNGANIEVKESFIYQVADDAGQTATSIISVSIVDDVPVANVTDGIAQNSSNTVIHGTLVDMGADTDGAHIVLSVGAMPDGLSSGGVELTYALSLDGSTITASAGSDVVFTLTGNADGSYIFHQVAPLDLSILTTDLQSSVGAGGPQPAYYFYTNGQFGSVEDAADWAVKITGSGLVNPSTQGMGVGNNLFESKQAETLRFEFDDEHASSVGGSQPNLTYIAKIGVVGLDGGETLTYTAYYVDGTNSGPQQVTSTDLVSGTFMVKAPDGGYLDYIDLAAGPTDTSVRINSFTAFTQDDAQPKILNFGYTAIDGDGDSISGTFQITTTNLSTLTGTPSNDAIGGGLGDNVIIGSAGNDLLTGGMGNDTFVFSLIDNSGNMQMQGNDTVTDLVLGDKLQFHNVLDIVGGGNGPDIADLNAQTVFSDVGAGNGDLLIQFTGGGSITLSGLGSQAIHDFTDLNNHLPGVVVVS